MNKKTLATLGLAAGMALTPLASSAQKASIEKDANKNLIEAIDTSSRDQKTDSIIFLDAQKDLELRKDIQELLEKKIANNKKIKRFKKKYGEEFVLDQMTSIISIIVRDLDYYGTFNQNGDYIPNEKRVQNLLKDIFPDRATEIAVAGAIVGAIASLRISSIIDGRGEKRRTIGKK